MGTEKISLFKTKIENILTLKMFMQIFLFHMCLLLLIDSVLVKLAQEGRYYSLYNWGWSGQTK